MIIKKDEMEDTKCTVDPLADAYSVTEEDAPTAQVTIKLLNSHLKHSDLPC